MFKSQYKVDGDDDSENKVSSRNEAKGAKDANTYSAQSRLSDFKNAAPKKPLSKSPSMINRDQAITEIDSYIRDQLKKDPKLPELESSFKK